jgi:DNA polymerase elongation subunit (family B)
LSKPYYTSFFRRGNKVFIRKVNEDKTRTNYSVEYKPKLYFKTDTPNCDYKTLNGDELHEVEFSDIKSAKGYADASTAQMFGYPRWEYACVDDEFPYEIEYDFADIRIAFLDIEVESDTHYSTVKNPDQPIVLIQLLYDGIIYIFGTDTYISYDNNVKFIKCRDEKDLLRKFVQLFRKFDIDLISGFHSQGYDIPMLYSRMNLIEMDDYFRKLSPFNLIETGEEEVFGKMQLRVDIKGIQHLDIMELIKKFDTKKYENNKLDTIAKAILKRGKVAYDGKLSDLMITDYAKFVEYGLVDVQLLREIEDEKNFIKMVVGVAYMDKCNYIDAFSQVRMWDNQIMTHLKHEYKIQVPFLIAKESDFFVEEDEEKKFEGAFVYQPNPNKYEWVMSDDVQSMHPSIIMSFNISPETYLGNSNKNVEYFLKECPQYTQELKDNNATSLANGAMFDNTYEGFLPKLIRRVFTMRIEARNLAKKHKKLVEELKQQSRIQDSIEIQSQIKFNQREYVKNDTLQAALKVKINSLFGFLGNKFSRFYQLDMAEGITLTSQVMLKSGAAEIKEAITEYTATTDQVLLYGDTDSLLYSMKSVVEKFVPKGTPKDKIVEFLHRFHQSKIAPRLTDRMTILQNRMNAREHSIKFIRDVISDVSILIAKKKYIMSVMDSEGTRYTEPDLKVMGVESVKTSTPQYCRDKIKAAIVVMLYQTNDELVTYLDKIREEFMTLPVEDISTPRGITDINKYTLDSVVEDAFGMDSDESSITHKKGCPMHVKAAIFHNKLIIENDLTRWIQPIENGDKIKFTYLKSPNPINNNAIAFDGKLPTEFKLDKYVDYGMQYEKTFLNPIKAITKVIGWRTESDNGMF